MDALTEKLFENTDEAYRVFSEKLIPDTKYKIIGVRTPIIKKIAKEAALKRNYLSFFSEKHVYHEECLLHGFIIGYSKLGFNDSMKFFKEFLPCIDNWAVCDCTVAGMKVFAKNTNELLKDIKEWIISEKPYEVRVGCVCLLNYFTDAHFSPEILELTFAVSCDNYYVDMALSWLYSVLLVKHYDKTVKIIEDKRLKKFVHNKAIQKALESYRISEEKKLYLKTLKIK